MECFGSHCVLRVKRLFISWDEIKYDIYGEKKQHPYVLQSKRFKGKIWMSSFWNADCKRSIAPSEYNWQWSVPPQDSFFPPQDSFFSFSGFFFPPQDFLIPIRHLGSAIQLTEEVSVIHSLDFSFPAQNNNVRKKGDPAIWQHQIAQATGVYPLWLVPAILDETGEEDPMFVDLGVYGWCQR